MTDITTKLRSALTESAFSGLAVVIAHADCKEAADEIDRLRAEVARLTEANRYLIGISNEAMEDARKYEEARLEVSRLRHEVAMLCGYDSVEEMDAAVGRRK